MLLNLSWHSKTPIVIHFVARNSLTNYVYIQGIFDTCTWMYFWLMGRPQIQNIPFLLDNLVAPSPQAENVVVCINMAPTNVVSLQSNLIATLLTGNKKSRKKKLATIICPVIIILVESRFTFICNNFPPLSFGKLLIHTIVSKWLKYRWRDVKP